MAVSVAVTVAVYPCPEHFHALLVDYAQNLETALGDAGDRAAARDESPDDRDLHNCPTRPEMSVRHSGALRRR